MPMPVLNLPLYPMVPQLPGVPPVTALSTFSNVKKPTSQDAVDGGTVDPQAPTPAQAAAIQANTDLKAANITLGVSRRPRPATTA
jgi:hypothetical protein